jgi:WXXGXW repeat (2 copies)
MHVNAVCNAVLMTIGLSAGMLLSPAASAGADVVSDAAPPPLRAERAPAARDGYVWGSGHWELSGHTYVWVSGTWIPERRGAHWIADHWDSVGSQWHYVPGHWER